MRESAERKTERGPVKGLLVLTGLVLAFAALRAGGEARPGEIIAPAGYIQVKDRGKVFFLEMTEERMKASEISGYIKSDFLVESGDAVEISLSDAGETMVTRQPRGMDNLIRYVLGQRMDINQATARELSLVPGLGIVRAERVFARREAMGGFSGWDDLKRDPEIGGETYSALRGYFYIAGDPVADGGEDAEP